MRIYSEALQKETTRALLLLRPHAFVKRFYLAGGTGLALQMGHRISGDLDFFTEEDFNELLLARRLSKVGRFELEKKSSQTVIGALNSVKISFLGYKYPLLAKLRNISGIKVADICDIACMKLDAIASRGTKRDFIDMYFIAREHIPLKEIFVMFRVKYASLRVNVMHIKKSMVYFEDADRDPMPNMLKPINWEEVKSFFRQEV